MRLADTGTVTYYFADVGAAMFKVVFHFATNATDYTAALNMDDSLDCILEHFHARLYGPTAIYDVKLYDAYGRDVLAQVTPIPSSAAIERMITATMGDGRLGKIQTMGRHAFFVDADAETNGVVELICRRPGARVL